MNTLFNKYEVIKIENGNSDIASEGYILKASRVVYTLAPTNRNKHLLMLLNSKGNPCNLHGYSRFTDENGILEPVVITGNHYYIDK